MPSFLTSSSTFLYAHPVGHIAHVHKMELLKKQMEVSEEMKQEYIKIRKWNHDIENHLFSLAYLIDMKKTDAAEKYCNSVLSNNIDHNNHTSVCKSLNQEDSIL